MLAANFCALACRRQCSAVALKQRQLAFTQRGRKICALARRPRRSAVRLRAKSSQLASQASHWLLPLSHLSGCLLVSYSR